MLQKPITISAPLEFPETDGEPLGETGIHVKQILDLLAALLLRFKNQLNVYCSAAMFLYWDPADPTEVVAPDVFVAFDVAPGERRTWKVWEEGKAPDVILEITSHKTRRKDIEKKALYEWLGVRELFLFDPLKEYLKPRLQGFRLVEGDYQSLRGETLFSEVLGLELRVVDDWLRLFDPASGQMLLTPVELGAALERSKVALAQAEAELARLRAELERLSK